MDSKTNEYLLHHYVNGSYNLAYGIKQPTASMKFNDFSNVYKPTTSFLSVPAKSTEELISFSANEWYNQDFTSDPFDGRIEIYVVGEPLPSINLSLLIACIVSIAVLQYRKHYLNRDFEIQKNTSL